MPINLKKGSIQRLPCWKRYHGRRSNGVDWKHNSFVARHKRAIDKLETSSSLPESIDSTTPSPIILGMVSSVWENGGVLLAPPRWIEVKFWSDFTENGSSATNILTFYIPLIAQLEVLCVPLTHILNHDSSTNSAGVKPQGLFELWISNTQFPQASQQNFGSYIFQQLWDFRDLLQWTDL